MDVYRYTRRLRQVIQMPRVHLNRKTYKVKDISGWIVGRMYSMNIHQKQMSEELGISQQAFSKKLKNSNFTYSDLLTIIKVLNPEDEEIVKLLRI